MKKKVIIAIITSMLIVSGISGAILAGESHTFSSKGRLVFDNGTSDTSDDVIFDAADLSAIETEVTTGKESIKTAINNVIPDKITDSNPTFETLVNAIPDIFTSGQNDGASSVWSEIAADTDLISKGYDNVTDLASLKEAIEADNETAHQEGVTEGETAVSSDPGSYGITSLAPGGASLGNRSSYTADKAGIYLATYLIDNQGPTTTYSISCSTNGTKLYERSGPTNMGNDRYAIYYVGAVYLNVGQYANFSRSVDFRRLSE